MGGSGAGWEWVGEDGNRTLVLRISARRDDCETERPIHGVRMYRAVSLKQSVYPGVLRVMCGRIGVSYFLARVL